MIISHKHKFIFIKTNKTAGTSLEIALSQICGEEDVITPISPEDESVRSTMKNAGPRNYRLSPDFSFRAHSTAEEIKARVAADVWSSYFKFCFERDPWDKVISHYYWQKRMRDYPTIQHYLDAGELANIKGFKHYSINGKVVVDEIYRFEELDAALKDLSAVLHLSGLVMPSYKAKSTYRDKNIVAEQFFTAAQAHTIGCYFAKEISLLGYRKSVFL